jgi:hypothetical protein
MMANGTLPGWLRSERIKPVAAAAAVFFFANVLLGQILFRINVQATETFLDDFAMASLGGLVVWLFLDWQARRQELAQARERGLLTARLNNQMRRAVSIMASAILFREQDDRLRVVDEAIQEIDSVLADLAETIVASSARQRGR